MSTTTTSTAFMANNYPADASYGTTRNGLVIDLPTAQAVWANINTYSQGQATDAMIAATMPEGKDNGAMVGDLVAIVGHGAVRSAVVVKVTKGGIQAAYKTPSTPQQVYRVALAKHDQGGERDGYTVVKRQAVRFEAPSLPEAAPAAKPKAAKAAAPAPAPAPVAGAAVPELGTVAKAAQAALQASAEQGPAATRQAIADALHPLLGTDLAGARVEKLRKRASGRYSALLDCRTATNAPAPWLVLAVDQGTLTAYDSRSAASAASRTA